jgi:hypothetical protein
LAIAGAGWQKQIYPDLVEFDHPPWRLPVMVPVQELCRIVESGFHPLSCACTVNADGTLRIKVYESTTGRIDLLLPYVSPAQLTSIRDISNLIGELRTEMNAGRRAFAG